MTLLRGMSSATVWGEFTDVTSGSSSFQETLGGIALSHAFTCRLEVGLAADVRPATPLELNGVALAASYTLVPGGVALVLRTPIPVPQLPSDNVDAGATLTLQLRYALSERLALRIVDPFFTFIDHASLGVPPVGFPSWYLALMVPAGIEAQVTPRLSITGSAAATVFAMQHDAGSPALHGWFPSWLVGLLGKFAIRNDLDVAFCASAFRDAFGQGFLTYDLAASVQGRL